MFGLIKLFFLFVCSTPLTEDSTRFVNCNKQLDRLVNRNIINVSRVSCVALKNSSKYDQVHEIFLVTVHGLF